MTFKKLTAVLLAATLLVGCGSTAAPAAPAEAPAQEAEAEAEAPAESAEQAEAPAENIHMDSLKLQFVPSRPAEEIITTTSGLPDLLIKEMANQGYDIDEVTIEVSSSFEAAGEALSAGSIDLAWLPSGTYIVYSDECDVIMTATRAGLSNDSFTPADWNGLENKTLRNGPQVSYYKGLIYAGPSPKGKELAAKANAGEEITWEDLDGAVWAFLLP